MGLAASDLDRSSQANACWDLPLQGSHASWTQFTSRRYGSGIAATGVSQTVALPHLQRRRLQAWNVEGFSFYLGPDFVSFGRKLRSVGRADAGMFFGVDVCFGQHSQYSRLWYNRSHEWLLRLHKAVLEPLPPAPNHSSSASSTSRWPGRPRYLNEEKDAATRGFDGRGDADGVANACAGVRACASSAAAPCPDLSCQAESSCGSPSAPDEVEHQLLLYLGNADGQVGILNLPVPRSKVKAVSLSISVWRTSCEVPLRRGADCWRTAEEFASLRESSLNMMDLLLLGLETEIAMTLTPDHTWEKYPRGIGEPTFPLSADEAEFQCSDVEGATLSVPSPASARADGGLPAEEKTEGCG